LENDGLDQRNHEKTIFRTVRRKKMICRLLTTIFFVLALTPQATFAQTISDYVILQDIGLYKLDRPEKMLPGRPPMGGLETFDSPGIVGAADHFSMDHTDKTYKIMYIGGNGIPSPTVFITKHAGSDSDKWLRHELDEAFRDDLGIPTDSYAPRIISGQTILVDSVGGRDYRWQSGNKIIAIEYHGSLRTLPEPIEVVQAYLTKHPSTLSALTLLELRSAANKTTWIKDEMDRRLWLCDKWFMQLQLKKAEEKQVYQESVKSMNIFLDYREKYYGLKAADEKNLLAGYLAQNNGTGIKAKLKEYKDWWVVNKDKQISIP
jgi:hypothetical protein